VLSARTFFPGDLLFEFGGELGRERNPRPALQPLKQQRFNIGIDDLSFAGIRAQKMFYVGSRGGKSIFGCARSKLVLQAFSETYP
jgi:hypothetical protein